MVEQADAELIGQPRERFRRLNVLLARLGTARRMIVRQDHGPCIEIHCAGNQPAARDRQVVLRTFCQDFFGEKAPLGVGEEGHETLVRELSDRRRKITLEAGTIGGQRGAHDLFAHAVEHELPHADQGIGPTLSMGRGLAHFGIACRDQAGQAAEACDQALGEFPGMGVDGPQQCGQVSADIRIRRQCSRVPRPVITMASQTGQRSITE